MTDDQLLSNLLERLKPGPNTRWDRHANQLYIALVALKEPKSDQEDVETAKKAIAEILALEPNPILAGDPGPAIKQHRKEQGLSLTVLAERSSVSRTGLWQVEQGKSDPSLNWLLKVCRGLGVSIQELLGL